MGLFDKKYCDICGDKIGLLGNRKLEDGNLCKKCAAKLSPWFSDRRRSTVADIKEQLDYREANKAEVAAFNATRTFGRNTKLIIDEDARKFMVTAARNLEEANPDVLEFSSVTGCDLNIDEHESEIKREIKDAQGATKQVSYNPPRFEYGYDFYMIIRVNNPYFDEIKFKLNGSEVQITPPPGANVVMLRNQNPEYAQYNQMGNEIKKTLTQICEDVRKEAAPKVAVTCPCCGATTMPDANGRCEYCGGAVN